MSCVCISYSPFQSLDCLPGPTTPSWRTFEQEKGRFTEQSCSKICWSSCLMQRRWAERVELLRASRVGNRDDQQSGLLNIPSSPRCLHSDQKATGLQGKPRQADAGWLLYAPSHPGASVSRVQQSLWSFSQWKMSITFTWQPVSKELWPF